MKEQMNPEMEISLHEMVKKSPKVAKMFDAVVSLVGEGADINTIKVFDITDRAGIGKGTAYEYFKTKEEIIVKAILYDMESILVKVDQELEKCSGFREKLECVLEWIEKNFNGSHSFAPFLNICQGSYQISASLKTEMMRQLKGYECVMQHGQILIEEGIRDGVLRKDLPMSMLTSAFTASLAAFLFFLNWPEKEEGATNAKMKAFICDNFIRNCSEITCDKDI